MIEQDELRDATEVVLSFANAMNDWETRMYYRSRADHGYEFTAERDARLAGPLPAAELNEEYHVHFKKHCTERKRSYGGFPGSWSKGGNYAGISAESVVEASQPKAKRIEVVCIGGIFPDMQFKFVLFKKSSGWLIDNAYTWSGYTGKWDRHYL